MLFTKINTAKTVRVFCLASLLCSFLSTASAEFYQEYTIRSGLTANLAIFTSWPTVLSKNNNPTINLCLVGTPALEEAFSNLNGKPIAEKQIQVRYLARLNNISDCQILYISDMDKNKLILLLNDIQNQPILTIGEDDFFIQNGGMVQLKYVDGKISIVVNLPAVKRAKLSLSARVLKLATVFQ